MLVVAYTQKLVISHSAISHSYIHNQSKGGNIQKQAYLDSILQWAASLELSVCNYCIGSYCCLLVKYIQVIFF